MKTEVYGSGNYQDFMNDSSNHAKEGEGVPEMLQRLAKEQKESEEKKKQISQKLLKGEL